MITKENRSDGKTEYFPVETSDDTKIGLCNSRTFVVADSSKLEEELGFSVY